MSKRFVNYFTGNPEVWIAIARTVEYLQPVVRLQL